MGGCCSRYSMSIKTPSESEKASKSSISEPDIALVTSKAELDELLKKEAKRLVVIDFFATWCKPCKMLTPKLVEMQSTYPKVKFVKVDVDLNEDIAVEFGIRGMPTLVFMKQSKAVQEVSGLHLSKVEEALKAHA